MNQLSEGIVGMEISYKLKLAYERVLDVRGQDTIFQEGCSVS